MVPCLITVLNIFCKAGGSHQKQKEMIELQLQSGSISSSSIS